MGRDARGRNFGRLKLWNCGGLRLVVSPDILMNLFPSALTIGLYVGAHIVAKTEALSRWSTAEQCHSQHYAAAGYMDIFITQCLVAAAIFFSLIVGLTDPGALPHVEKRDSELGTEYAKISGNGGANANGVVVFDEQTKRPVTITGPASGDAAAAVGSPAESAALIAMPHERTHLIDWADLGFKDPYAENTHWIECRSCKLRRPPRAAHCYTCNVCTLSSDHHCGVVGGCVSIRSLRWFWAYLVCVSSAALNTMSWIMGGIFSKENNKNPGSVAAHITLLIFIGNIVLMVGGLACFYTYLVLVDQTRRESQGKHKSKSKSGGSGQQAHEYYHEELTPRLLDLQQRPFGHLWRVLFPPPSLIAWTPGSTTV